MSNDELEPGNPYSNPWNWRAVWHGQDPPQPLEHGNLLTLDGTGQIIIEYVGPSAPHAEIRCTYAQASSCRTPCDGPMDRVLVYRSPRTGKVLDRSAQCRGHAAEAERRALAAGSIAEVSVEPMDGAA